MADTEAEQREGEQRELRWWELEGLPVPPAWTSAHPGHPDYVEPPPKRRRVRGAEPTPEERELFGI